MCFGTYHSCPMFHRINREMANADAQPDTLVTITLSHDGIPLPLRATGT